MVVVVISYGVDALYDMFSDLNLLVRLSIHLDWYQYRLFLRSSFTLSSISLMDSKIDPRATNPKL